MAKTFNHGESMPNGHGLPYASIPATFDVPPVPPTDADGNYILNDDDPSTDDQYSSYSNNTSGSVSYTSGGKGVWTDGNSYTSTNGNTLTEINGHAFSRTSGWTETYFYGGKFECTIGITMAMKIGEETVTSLAPKYEFAIAPFGATFKTGAGLSFTAIDDYKIASLKTNFCKSAQQISTEENTVTINKMMAAEFVMENILTKEDSFATRTAIIGSDLQNVTTKTINAATLTETATAMVASAQTWNLTGMASFN